MVIADATTFVNAVVYSPSAASPCMQYSSRAEVTILNGRNRRVGMRSHEAVIFQHVAALAKYIPPTSKHNTIVMDNW